MHSLLKLMEKHDQQDFLMQSAREWITQNQFTDISISKIQRHFRIGYNRAANILDMLEREGHIRNKFMEDNYE
ncbi:DNA translocase FtsK [Hafnia alvei]|uniref:DNA translocase FtsK n=1 Tax=Proteus vulgaris TaxID=585 RepID=UPI00299E7E24|nr:DNA translocase FtsK [Proteus vulgaris]WOO48775.1 DNA translocase FtsK [Hafnia alvei]WPF03241.1 DNA translocase FtsK [Proteus vulgaris]